MREIPQCWLTGHAAGVGSALAVAGGVEPRAVDVHAIRGVLREQGVFLSTMRRAKGPQAWRRLRPNRRTSIHASTRAPLVPGSS